MFKVNNKDSKTASIKSMFINKLNKEKTLAALLC